jgi:hypothetical protein
LQQADTEGAAQFVLTPAQETLLNGIAESTSPVRGYARGVLASLLDRRFYPEELAITAERSVQDVSKTQNTEALKVSPVPAVSILEVEWALLPEVDDIITLSLFDMYGSLLLQEQATTISKKHALRIGELPIGTYLLVVSNRGHLIGKKTFVIQR